jgi:hypothetical protein
LDTSLASSDSTSLRYVPRPSFLFFSRLEQSFQRLQRASSLLHRFSTTRLGVVASRFCPLQVFEKRSRLQSTPSRPFGRQHRTDQYPSGMMTADMIEQYERESKNTKADSFKQRCKGNCYLESSLLVAWEMRTTSLVVPQATFQKKANCRRILDLGWRIHWNPTDS